MFEYFWRQQDDIPAGMGYPLFGAAHLISVGITLGLVALAVVLALKTDREAPAGNAGVHEEDTGESTGNDRERKRGEAQRKLLRGIPIVMVLLELIKDCFLIKVGRFGIGYLPLHVCSIGIFVFLLREFAPGTNAPGTPGEGKRSGLRAILGEIAVILIMPASLAGLVFADWTELYPVLNFINLHSYLWHGLLILYPLLLLISGEVQPSIRHIHRVILFLCIVVPPIYVFDKFTGCNYFFVNRPVPGSPLSWLASFMGNPGYLIGYAALTLAVMLVVYLAIHAAKKLLT